MVMNDSIMSDSTAAKCHFPPNPQISYTVFAMLSVYHWDVYNDIWGGMDL